MKIFSYIKRRETESIGRRRMTLVEVLIATSLSLILLGGFMSFFLMVKSGVKSGQSQVWLHNDARYGTQQLTRMIQEARIAVSRDNGTEVYIINPNDTASLIYYEDADDDPDTTSDNIIWYDPDSESGNDERAMVRNVSQIGSHPIFSNIRGGVALSYHVGDPPDIGSGDKFTGKGYQGLQIQVVAKPRNVGHIWTSQGYD